MPGHDTTERLAIALQPIHDTAYRHVADRLVYSRPPTAGDDPVSRTAQALSAAVYELDEGQRLGARPLFIDLPAEWLVRQDLLPTPADRLVIGLAAGLVPTPELVDALENLRERGYRIAAPASDCDLTGFADIVRLPAKALVDAQAVAVWQARGKRLLVEDIQTQEQLEHARAQGVDYVNGHYLSDPRFLASRPSVRHGNRAALLRLINELYREDADLQRLFELILQMPQLHVAILRRANSSHFAHGAQHSELKRAMQVIGLNELRKLVMTLSLANEMPSSRLMLRLALTRAFMCQALAAPFRNIDPEDAFTTGLFSMMGALLDLDQASLLAELPLEDALRRALTRREGHLGALLALSEEHERALATASSQTPPTDRLQACYLEALDRTDALMSRL
ncbi:EAL and HDOD domain-containing protein [Halomonas nitroreducens]|uniref:HDOD domain-containing protein n=1 Tax=Halomonas nitroreducens TaxID=447425 RepID=A0A431V3L8_9GAMM|nr:HDOD domain-containing protein [Halomonas nitroreducens]RTR04444.1 HDOD domain-containing protein [Halomonas nitroreducens]